MSGATAVLWLLGVAHADRPDEGAGLHPYDAADVLSAVDGPEGRVRVHFSVSGPNATLLDDDDADGAPDFPALVAQRGEAVLDAFAAAGFRAPVAEEELGLDGAGGSPAFDIYLVDFGGSADGQFAVDACAGDVCTGHFLIENDFAGYGYPDLAEAVEVLTRHELFHAVQAAYTRTLPSWASEGTATWAEDLLSPPVDDFYRLCSAYLLEPERSLDRPPAGVTTAWSYGTALFFSAMSLEQGPGAIAVFLEEMAGRDEAEAVAAIDAALRAGGGTLPSTFARFAVWNAATGRRHGELEGWPFGDALRTVNPTAEGARVDDELRFYPLAAHYFRLDHPGGPLAFATAEDPSGLVLQALPVADGRPDGPVREAGASVAPRAPGVHPIGDLPAGGVWVVAVVPAPRDESVKIPFCLGPAEAVAECGPGPAVDTGGDTAAGGVAGAAAENGCGCRSVPGSALPAGLGLLLAVTAARRARRPTPPAC